MENLSTSAKRPILLKDGKTVLTTGLDWRNHKIEYNAWRRLWRDTPSAMLTEWKDFDTFCSEIPARSRAQLSLRFTESGVLAWSE